ncbi:GCN5-related N-acetyltransferase [Enhygromyxa salina]|uniref:GCN5-related N-acetyltransferase n=1 Tax=Enhygromyxa salina TaxID=215803 RepID=A0A0C2DAW2_9BACT|nr:GNAT family N-acetyltransferase [Enhygromyxa salina]KIG17007.1 GCN5-related N-acetyltransferase [Enhygromyxa salina]
MHQTFETARMWLRPVAEADIDALVSLDADPEVMRYISGGAPNLRSDYEQGLLARMLVHADQAFGYFSAFTDAGEGTYLGWFHLRPSVFDSSMLELGYRLRRETWGRGLATEGSLALLDHAFEALGQTVVDACAMPDNAASIAVMRKCGMTYAGMFNHPRLETLQVVRYWVRSTEYAAK